jgi:glycerol uptake facilitator-like aquaporin
MDPRKLGAEALGTFWLVLGGCGSAVLAAGFEPATNLGIGLVGVSWPSVSRCSPARTRSVTSAAATSTRR